MIVRARIVLACLAGLVLSQAALAQQVVISQVYGNGGGTGANWRNDYIEIFNAGQNAANISGWSIQYAGATGSTWAAASLTGTIPAGRYYLIQLAGSSGNGALLPTPDAVGTFALAPTSGKVALVRTSVLLSGTCPLTNPDVVDLLGYGTSGNCAEGTRFNVTLTATQAAYRRQSGCMETENNLADFEALTAAPRNSLSPANICNPLVIPLSQALTPQLPSIGGDGVLVEVFNNIGGGPAPTPALLVGLMPTGATLSPLVDFPHPGNTITVGQDFTLFFADTTTPPDALRAVPARNFIARTSMLLRVERSLDRDPSTPNIDLRLAVGSDDGFYLQVGTTFLGQSADRSFTTSVFSVQFEDEGLYPMVILFAANAQGQSGLEFSWITSRNGGAREIVPQAFMYLTNSACARSTDLEEFPPGTSISDQYRDRGILFNVTSGNPQVTDARPTEFVPVSGTRVFADPAENPVDQGQVEFTFVRPGTNERAAVNFFSLFIIDAEETGATVTAFDPGGTVLFASEFHGGGAAREQVNITRPLMSRVVVTLGQGADTSAIDNICWSEPSSIASPDLQIEALDTPPSGYINTQADAAFRIRNAGDMPAAGAWVDRVYLSTDDQPGQDQLVAEYPRNGPLAPAAFYDQVAGITLPAVPGNYWVVVVTDAANNLSEIPGENNNTRISDDPIVVTYPPSPDLHVTALDIPTTGLTTQPFDVTWTVRNSGDGPATGTWTDRVIISTDNILGNGNDTLLSDVPFTGALAVNSSYVRSRRYNFPSQPGNYWIYVFTDASNTQTEYGHEDNNVFISAMPIVVELLPQPDLVVREIIPPSDHVLSGSVTVVSFVIRNQGTGVTETTSWQDGLFISTNNTQLGTFIRDVNNPQFLLPGEEFRQDVAIQLPNDVTGTYYIAVQADRNGRVAELNETNNTRFSTPFIIDLAPQPDLIAEVVQFSPNPAFSGLPLSVTWTDRNQGAGPTDSGNWSDRVWLSLDNNLSISQGDIPLGNSSRNGGILAPGQADTSRSLTGTIPVNVQGMYYLKVRVDISDQVTEFGFEGNNFAVSLNRVTIILSVPSDLVPTEITGPTTGIPGHTVDVTWSAENFGAPPQMPVNWNDAIYLSVNRTFEPGSDVLLGVFGHGSTTDQQGNPTIDPYTNTRTLRLPNNTGAGQRYFIVVVDSGNNVFEDTAGEANNVLAATNPIVISLSTSTDLTIAVNFDQQHQLPTSAAANQAINLSWRVTNSGTAITPVSSWTDRAYFSTNNTLDGGDTQLASVGHSPALPPGGNYIVERTVNTPLVSPGNYFLLFQTDADNSVYEQAPGENNNIIARPFSVVGGAADLQLTDFQIPPTAESGQTIHIEWEVINSGTLATNTGAWTDTVILSRDNQYGGGDDLILGSRTHSGVLAPTQAYAQSGDFSLPINLSGMYHVIKRIDSGNAVFETNENNNTLVKPLLVDVQLADPANLIVEAVDAADMAISGQSLAINWTVRNIGPGPTNAANWQDSVYLSRDQFLEPELDVFLGVNGRSGPLASDGTYTVSRSFNVPFGLSGPYFAIVRVDSGNHVWENGLDNDNDRADSSLTDVIVPPPSDLVVDEITPPAAGVLGQPATFRWRIRNAGDQPVNGSWQDSLYLSRDDTWDINDKRIGTFTRPPAPLNPGERTAELSATTPIPGVLPGTYFVIVRTDVFNQIPETNEANNLGGSAATFPISAIPLTLGVPFVGELATNEETYFQLDTPEGETVRISLDHASPVAWSELYVKLGGVPTRGDFDFIYPAPAQPDQVITIPTTGAATYYILAAVTAGASPGQPTGVTVRADVLPYSVGTVSPSSGGNVGQVTLLIEGARFDGITKANLQHSTTGEQIIAVAQQALSATRLAATFDLNGAAVGAYDVHAISEEDIMRVNRATGEVYVEHVVNGDATLPAAFEVVAGGGPSVQARMVLPSAARIGTAFSYIVEIGNSGNVDAPVPFILVASPNGTPISVDPGVNAGSGSQLQVMPLGAVRLDVLRPGERVAIRLYSLAAVFPSSRFKLQNMSEAVTPIDWNLLAAYYRDSSNQNTWNATWSRFRQSVGNSWAELHAAMRCAAMQRYIGSQRQLFTGEELILDLLGAARSGRIANGMCDARFLRSDVVSIPFEDRAACMPPADCPYGPGRPGTFIPCGCQQYYGLNEGDLLVLNLDLTIGLGRALLSRWFCSDWLSVLDDYLAGTCENRPGLRTFADGSEPANQLRDDPETKTVVDTIMEQARRMATQRCPSSLAPCGGTMRVSLDSLVPEQYRRNIDIRYNAACTCGGGMVGGTGAGDAGPDSRHAMGYIEIKRVCDCDDTRTTSIEMTPDFEIEVNDYFDFCPGDLGSFTARFFTEPMATLEANNRAYDVPLKITFNVNRDHFSPITIPASAFSDSCEPDNCATQPPASPCSPPCDDECGEGNQDPGEDCCEGPDCDGDVPTRGASDPNEKAGPGGFGAERWIARSLNLPYRVLFENVPDATAPAARVTLTDPLDPGLAPGTFRVGDMRFGDTIVDVPDNRLSFQTRVDLRATRGVFVDITAGVNAATREAFWIFQSIDPATGEPPTDPQLGFLPPNDATHRGEGYAEYTIRPIAGITTGTVVRNSASIVFDVNEPIVTNEVFNTVDGGTPNSAVVSPNGTVPDRTFTVQWSGLDDSGGSGLATFSVFQRREDGAYTLFARTAETSAPFTGGRGGETYAFYSTVSDNAGNVEAAPSMPDVTVTIAAQTPPAPTISGPTAATILLQSLGDVNLDRIDHAVFEESTGQWVGPVGRLTAQPHWARLDSWRNIRVRALSANTNYRFKAKARTAPDAETPFGPAMTVRTTRPGDVNGDNLTNEADVAILQGVLGTRYPEAAFDPRADVTGDDIVTFRDLGIVRRNIDQ